MSTSQSSQSEHTEVAVAPAEHDTPVGFFAIGIVINLVLLGAYFAWAWRQWKKSGSREDS